MRSKAPTISAPVMPAKVARKAMKANLGSLTVSGEGVGERLDRHPGQEDLVERADEGRSVKARL